jgi:hypothetical protein
VSRQGRRPRWGWALIVAVVTSGLAVAINLATDLKDSWWAWLAVATLTVASGGISAWLLPSDAPHTTPPAPTEQQPSTSNQISGTVQGSAIQSGTISGPVTVTDHSGPITQNAVASDNATIQQAGRDIHNGPPPPP